VLPKPNGNGWSNIGYHKVILNGHLSSKHYNESLDGSIETGRPLDDDNLLEKGEYGAHVKGFNSQSIGVCLIGKSNDFTPNQLATMIKTVKDLKGQFSNYDVKVVQHSDLDPKKPFCAGLHDEVMRALNIMEE